MNRRAASSCESNIRLNQHRISVFDIIFQLVPVSDNTTADSCANRTESVPLGCIVRHQTAAVGRPVRDGVRKLSGCPKDIRSADIDIICCLLGNVGQPSCFSRNGIQKSHTRIVIGFPSGPVSGSDDVGCCRQIGIVYPQRDAAGRHVDVSQCRATIQVSGQSSQCVLIGCRRNGKSRCL